MGVMVWGGKRGKTCQTGSGAVGGRRRHRGKKGKRAKKVGKRNLKKGEHQENPLRQGVISRGIDQGEEGRTWEKRNNAIGKSRLCEEGGGKN